MVAVFVSYHVVWWHIFTLIDPCSIILPSLAYKCFWMDGNALQCSDHIHLLLDLEIHLQCTTHNTH
jgi:hypothetical protein